MTSFLFWNLNQKPLQDTITNLAYRLDVDVLMLAECKIRPDILLDTLNANREFSYLYSPKIRCDKIDIYTRFPEKFISPIYEEDRITIRHLNLPGFVDILLVIAHLPSKFNWSNESQSSWCFELSRTIQKEENRVNNSRTVIIGDLNMNPFENGIISANGLHGMMTHRIAEQRFRVVQSEPYPFFYNPMWNLFGDSTPGPAGTYFYRNSDPVSYFWNMFDQVLIRPDLLSLFSAEDLKIVESDGNHSFLTDDGLPNSKVYSDHLPIYFKLKL